MGHTSPASAASSRAVVVLLLVTALLGCGNSHGSAAPADGGADHSADTSGYNLGNDASMLQGTLDVEPAALQTITVQAGQMTPTVAYTATVNGQPATVTWGVDQGAIGTVAAGPSSTALFVPSGTTGGMVNVRATADNQTVTRQVLVLLTSKQNGSNSSPGEQQQLATTVAQLSAGGGIGGVGGEGLGGPVTDPATLNALANPSSNGQAQMLAMLYPYDKTVWPRGMLAPLLMWSWAMNDADAIAISLSTKSGSFSWTGTFGRPPILMMTNGPFIRHPIPQDVWTMATDTAAGTDQLTVHLTIAKGGQGYGPLTETWTIAPALLTGTVYYNSYATQLVKNWATTDSAGNRIGAAILGVRSGDTGPTLIAGQNSTDDSGCRVCHVVSSRGRWLLTQSEQGSPGDGQSYLYDLTSPNVQASAVALPQQGVFAWAAMVSDGSYALSNAIDPSSTNPGITNSAAGNAVSSFWQFGAAPAAATATGLPAGLAAGYPSYAPDDKYIAYVDVTGQTNNVMGGLVAGSYDATSHAFSNLQKVQSPQPMQRVGYPVFLPDDSGILFETQVRSGSDQVMATRNGARSELWWLTTGATPMASALANLNGKGYLPIGINNHGIAGYPDPQSSFDETGFDDTTLNYEPTVLPLSAGGYAWVVFTSRRMYGNELTSVPWKSWPPDYDTTDLSQATVKKLWVAAIDLSATPGEVMSGIIGDPSHPAFYLPAQEILAGNSRGFWVLDPCKANGQACQSGDQCCNGYCEPSGDGGALICANTAPTCSMVQDKCTTAADCCDPGDQCIAGFCAVPSVN